MILSMQTREEAAQNLPVGDMTMTTGEMGDCVSVIVLWTYHQGSYISVRGFHGLGGFEAINLDSLFQGVPNEAGTIVHCIYGRVAQASGDREKAVAEMHGRIPAATTTHHNISNASVTRTNNVMATVGAGAAAGALRRKMCVIL